MAENKLEVHVVTPERELWSGEADTVVARSVEGELAILPGHAPLLALLDIGPLRVKTNGDEERAAVDGGFLHVNNDRVDVLAEHAELESEIDQSEARRREEEARRRLDGEHQEEARAELAKALTRLNLTGG
jgi:F-type H+-transporting ATPase subunit epsilon